MITLDEAIDKYIESAERNERTADNCDMSDEDDAGYAKLCLESATEFRQLAEWLTEYKRMKETCNQSCNKLATDCKSDTISRQAAIEEVLGYLDGDCFCDEGDFWSLINDLENLPPTQPERKKGEWLSQTEYCKKHNLIPSGIGVYNWCSE